MGRRDNDWVDMHSTNSAGRYPARCRNLPIESTLFHHPRVARHAERGFRQLIAIFADPCSRAGRGRNNIDHIPVGRQSESPPGEDFFARVGLNGLLWFGKACGNPYMSRKPYFIPVVSIPVAIFLRKKANTTVIGSSVSTVIARIRCH